MPLKMGHVLDPQEKKISRGLPLYLQVLSLVLLILLSLFTVNAESGDDTDHYCSITLPQPLSRSDDVSITVKCNMSSLNSHSIQSLDASLKLSLLEPCHESLKTTSSGTPGGLGIIVTEHLKEIELGQYTLPAKPLQDSSPTKLVPITWETLLQGDIQDTITRCAIKNVLVSIYGVKSSSNQDEPERVLIGKTLFESNATDSEIINDTLKDATAPSLPAFVPPTPLISAAFWSLSQEGLDTKPAPYLHYSDTSSPNSIRDNNLVIAIHGWNPDISSPRWKSIETPLISQTPTLITPSLVHITLKHIDSGHMCRESITLPLLRDPRQPYGLYYTNIPVVHIISSCFGPYLFTGSTATNTPINHHKLSFTIKHILSQDSIYNVYNTHQDISKSSLSSNILSFSFYNNVKQLISPANQLKNISDWGIRGISNIYISNSIIGYKNKRLLHPGSSIVSQLLPVPLTSTDITFDIMTDKVVKTHCLIQARHTTSLDDNHNTSLVKESLKYGPIFSIYIVSNATSVTKHAYTITNEVKYSILSSISKQYNYYSTTKASSTAVNDDNSVLDQSNSTVKLYLDLIECNGKYYEYIPSKKDPKIMTTKKTPFVTHYDILWTGEPVKIQYNDDLLSHIIFKPIFDPVVTDTGTTTTTTAATTTNDSQVGLPTSFSLTLYPIYTTGFHTADIEISGNYILYKNPSSGEDNDNDDGIDNTHEVPTSGKIPFSRIIWKRGISLPRSTYLEPFPQSVHSLDRSYLFDIIKSSLSRTIDIVNNPVLGISDIVITIRIPQKIGSEPSDVRDYYIYETTPYNTTLCSEARSGPLCTCKGGYTGHKCDVEPCPEGFYGPHCLQSTECPLGFMGYECSQEIQCGLEYLALNSCTQNGVVELIETTDDDSGKTTQSCSDKCTCDPAWNGDECQCPIGYSGLNCLQTTECPDGFIGYECQQQIECGLEYLALHSCYNNGVVEMLETFDEDGTISRVCLNKCTCNQGWHGDECKCPVGYSGFNCLQTEECPEGFMGYECSQELQCGLEYLALNSCTKNGVVELIETAGEDDVISRLCSDKCTCDPAWNGDECQCPMGYSGFNCLQTTECPEGFMGHECSQDIQCGLEYLALNSCHNNGVVDFVQSDTQSGTLPSDDDANDAPIRCSDKCTCDPAWNGDDCKCPLGYSGLNCLQSTECPLGFMGDKCKQDIVCGLEYIAMNSCSNNGIVEFIENDDENENDNGGICSDTCTCNRGWHGDQCEILSCPEGYSGPNCLQSAACPEGYMGDDCKQSIQCGLEYLSLNMCHNNGIIQPLISDGTDPDTTKISCSQQCKCYDGWSGDECSEKQQCAEMIRYLGHCSNRGRVDIDPITGQCNDYCTCDNPQKHTGVRCEDDNVCPGVLKSLSYCSSNGYIETDKDGRCASQCTCHIGSRGRICSTIIACPNETAQLNGCGGRGQVERVNGVCGNKCKCNLNWEGPNCDKTKNCAEALALPAPPCPPGKIKHAAINPATGYCEPTCTCAATEENCGRVGIYQQFQGTVPALPDGTCPPTGVKHQCVCEPGWYDSRCNFAIDCISSLSALVACPAGSSFIYTYSSSGKYCRADCGCPGTKYCSGCTRFPGMCGDIGVAPYYPARHHCNELECRCKDLFSGPFCKQEQPCYTYSVENLKRCNGYGYVETLKRADGSTYCYDKCVCFGGWSGKDCSIPPPQFCNDECDNTTTFCDKLYQKCRCTKEFDVLRPYNQATGKLAYCAPPCPCQNGGECSKYEPFIECQCPQGWGGNLCERRIKDYQTPPSKCTKETFAPSLCPRGTIECDSDGFPTCICPSESWITDYNLIGQDGVGTYCNTCILASDDNPNRCFKDGTHPVTYTTSRCPDGKCICLPNWTGEKCDRNAIYAEIIFDYTEQFDSDISNPHEYQQALVEFIRQHIKEEIPSLTEDEIRRYVNAVESSHTTEPAEMLPPEHSRMSLLIFQGRSVGSESILEAIATESESSFIRAVNTLSISDNDDNHDEASILASHLRWVCPHSRAKPHIPESGKEHQSPYCITQNKFRISFDRDMLISGLPQETNSSASSSLSLSDPILAPLHQAFNSAIVALQNGQWDKSRQLGMARKSQIYDHFYCSSLPQDKPLPESCKNPITLSTERLDKLVTDDEEWVRYTEHRDTHIELPVDTLVSVQDMLKDPAIFKLHQYDTTQPGSHNLDDNSDYNNDNNDNIRNINTDSIQEKYWDKLHYSADTPSINTTTTEPLTKLQLSSLIIGAIIAMLAIITVIILSCLKYHNVGIFANKE